MTKALLLRVGIDKGSGGSHAPIFPSGVFEYVPIPEAKQTSYPYTYSTLIGRSGKPLSEFVRHKVKDATPHFDPEFDTRTYGDPTPNKRRQLLRLERGDLLVFYAGLQPRPEIDDPRLYIIGLIDVDQVHDLGRVSVGRYPELRRRIGDNAHLFRSRADEALVIVQGRKNGSRLFDKALPLGDSTAHMLPDLCQLGYNGSLLRSIGHWIKGESQVEALRSMLEQGPASLITPKTRLYRYVVATDRGCAPNPFGGYCTLALCKPNIIRKGARVGDWVVGLWPKRWRNEFTQTWITYAMRVNEVLTFDEYFNDERFQAKKPCAMKSGDNIYCRDEKGQFIQLKNNCHHQKNTAKDTRVDRLLVGSLFWYFGGTQATLPVQLGYVVPARRASQYSDMTESKARAFISWLSENYRVGIHGEPRDGVGRNHSHPRRPC